VGDFRYTAMEPAGRIWAFFFFISFMCLVVLVMLAMLIAIIMDAYVEVKAENRTASTLWFDLYSIVFRAWECWRGRRMLMERSFGLKCTSTGTPRGEIPPTESELALKEFREASGKSVWLDNMQDDVDAKLHSLESKGWLNAMTWHVKVTFLIYNPAYDFFSMTSVHFLFPRSGRIWKKITHKSLILDPYSNTLSFLVTLAFYMYITYICLGEIVELCTTWCHAGTLRQTIKEYVNVWNAIDWLVIFASYTWLVLDLRYVNNVANMQAYLISALNDRGLFREIIFQKDFIHSVSGLSNEQAREVLLAAVEEYGRSRMLRKQPQPLDLQEAVDAVMELLIRSKESITYPAADQLARLVPLEDLLRAASLRIERRRGLPRWSGGEDMLKHLLGRALDMCGGPHPA